MTTIILMQKLLTMKLDQSDFKRIKSEQAKLTQKKQKVIKSLKKIIAQQASNKTCRLCLRQGGNRIFGGKQDFDVALNIRHILGIEIAEDDGKPQSICRDCEQTVRQAMRLKETAEITQWRLQQELDMVGKSASEWSDGDGGYVKTFDAEVNGVDGGYLETYDAEVEVADGGYVKTFDAEVDGADGGYVKTFEAEVDGADGYVKSVKTFDADIERDWLCDKCRATFCTQDELRAHAQVCEARRVCETCGAVLASAARLKTHRTIHTDSLPYACSSCAYRARTMYALRDHLRLHTGARPMRCGSCPATFSSSSNLASHRRSHLPPRFHCPLCQRGFKCKVNLNNHMATQHSNAKPFVCDICPKAFSTRKMVLRHELKAHNRPKMRPGVLPTYLRLQDT